MKSPDVSVKVEHWQVLLVLKLHVGNIAYVAFAADSQEADQLLIDKEMNVVEFPRSEVRSRAEIRSS